MQIACADTRTCTALRTPVQSRQVSDVHLQPSDEVTSELCRLHDMHTLTAVCGVQQTFVGICGWLSPQALLGLLVWVAALMLLDAVRGGRLQVPWLHLQPSQDVETGRLEIT